MLSMKKSAVDKKSTITVIRPFFMLDEHSPGDDLNAVGRRVVKAGETLIVDQGFGLELIAGGKAVIASQGKKVS